MASVGILLLAIGASRGSAFQTPRAPRGTSVKATLKMSLADYADELRATAKAMVAPGKGLLACDESTGTVGKRLESIGLENIEANRQAWRNLLFTTEGLEQFVSGAILFEETLFQSDPDGRPFVDVLSEKSIIPGIKVDMGLKDLVGGNPGEKWCSGLDTLYERCVKYYVRGARFAKWRTALQIDAISPSNLAVDVAAMDLARYARICQECGLVPIVEPEVLIDGNHDVHKTAKVQERVMTTVYKRIEENGVLLEGSIVKPAMTVPGIESEAKSDPAEIAQLTVQTLERSLPAAVPGVTFLSGGISEEDSSIYLNEINKIDRVGPWRLTFSFSRALQSSCLKTWAGKPENIPAAQEQLRARAQANSEASLGTYVPGSQPSSEESLFVKNYVY